MTDNGFIINDNSDLKDGQTRKEAAYLSTGDVIEGKGTVDYLNFTPANDSVEVVFSDATTATYHQTEKVITE